MGGIIDATDPLGWTRTRKWKRKEGRRRARVAFAGTPGRRAAQRSKEDPRRCIPRTPVRESSALHGGGTVPHSGVARVESMSSVRAALGGAPQGRANALDALQSANVWAGWIDSSTKKRDAHRLAKCRIFPRGARL